MSPWESGEYALSNSGLIHFPAGQARGRVTLTVASDKFREDDQRSILSLRDAMLADTEYAVVAVKIEDDDQRAFEDRLPNNTITYLVPDISINNAFNYNSPFENWYRNKVKEPFTVCSSSWEAW